MAAKPLFLTQVGVALEQETTSVRSQTFSHASGSLYHKLSKKIFV